MSLTRIRTRILDTEYPKALRILLYVEQDYSFDILRPIQAEARMRGCDVRWIILPTASSSNLKTGETQLGSARAAVEYSPDAVFVPGDRVPAFIPGIKVEVMHGISEDKRGNTYPERGLFDLYCTEGPARSADLRPLQKTRNWFRVKETGWVKLDTLLGYQGQAYRQGF